MNGLRITRSDRFIAHFPDIALATADVRAISRDALQERLGVSLPAILEELRATGSLARMNAYDAIFERFGYRSPLPKQLRLTVQKGFPSIDPLVMVMLAQEMKDGILIGAHDAERIEGSLVFELATEGETYQGMRGPIVCKQDEIVARDARSIIFSYFQGADDRTCIGSATCSVIYFAFGAPGMTGEILKQSLQSLVTLIDDAARNAHVSLHV